MNIIVSGASGLVGTACSATLRAMGHDVRALTRDGKGGLPWNVETGLVNLQGFAPDVLIHLAGENIADGRWTEARKERIRSSRVDATRKLCDFLSRCDTPPKTLLSASAIGLYGGHRDQWLTERTPPASDFLGQLCLEWERATEPLQRIACRVVHMRFGIVLSPNGGALQKMLPPFKLGLGGPIGGGEHWMSWIAMDDLVRAILFAMERDDVRGPVNFVAPNPVTNAEFAHTLAHVLDRRAFLSIPAGVLRLLYGDFVDQALITSQRVQPQRLNEFSFTWKHPELEEALRSML